MTDTAIEKRQVAKAAGEALAFFLLICILIGLAYHAYCVLQANGPSSYPFMHEFREGTLVGWSADWLVFVFLLVHAVRLAFGVLFLMHDDTLLATFDPDKRWHLVLKKLLFVFAIALFLSLVALVLTMRSEVLHNVLLGQATILLVIDVVYSWWLLKDKDWRWNVLIYIGDLAFWVFVYLEYIFLNECGPVLLRWFGLTVYTVVIINIIILVLEVPFTYGNSIKNAAHNFTKSVWSVTKTVWKGVSWVWGATVALWWPIGDSHVDKS